MVPCALCQHSCLTTDGSIRYCYGWYDVERFNNWNGSRRVRDNDTCERGKLRTEEAG